MKASAAVSCSKCLTSADRNLAWRKIIYSNLDSNSGSNRVSRLDLINAKIKEGRTHLAQDRDFGYCRMLVINKRCLPRTKP